ncbi:MAG TPA: tRNA-binding protein [Crocinitomix sp.]|nr:tRNA-binding protein [Crocinitomix sp.]
MSNQTKPLINWEVFSAIDMRVGTILSAKHFLKAKNPSYILTIDFGDLGIKKSAAQITNLYTIEELIGQQIIAVVNFPPKQIANIMSECLVLGILGNKKDVTLLQPQQKVANGLKIG